MATEIKTYAEGELNIYKITQGPLLTNIYIVSHLNSKDTFIIDPIKPTNIIKDIISDNKLNPKAIILTHGHIDHMEGIHDFDLPVMIHYNDLEYLENPNLNLSNFTNIIMDKGKLNIKTIKDDENIDLAEINFRAINTPGHTPGCISLYTKNILFSGDTLFFDSIGRCDLPGGNCKKLVASIREKLFILPDKTKVFPGHGPLTTIGREKQYNPFL